jgi:hypothetical protein
MDDDFDDYGSDISLYEESDEESDGENVQDLKKVHIIRHLFVCFQTSVYTLGEFHKNRNNSTVFEELSVSIVDLTVANICFTGAIKG